MTYLLLLVIIVYALSSSHKVHYNNDAAADAATQPHSCTQLRKAGFWFLSLSLSLSLSRLRLSVRGAVSTGGSGVGLRQWWCRCHSLLLLSRLEPNKNWSTTSVGDIRISLVLVVGVTPLVIGFARSTRERESVRALSCPVSYTHLTLPTIYSV